MWVIGNEIGVLYKLWGMICKECGVICKTFGVIRNISGELVSSKT